VFIVPAEADGVEVVRNIPHLGSEMTGAGHAEIKYNNVRVPEEHLLGEEGKGFKHVQERLGPARLTHCMRYSGMAERALDIAAAYMSERDAFGTALSEKQYPRFELADQRTRLAAARSLVRTVAAEIAAGKEARVGVSMAKVFTANAAQEAIDTALQFCGGTGISRDLPLADFYESVRAFRIVDGADEVHRRTIARELFEDPPREELETLTRFRE
jgi:acyl-CoA dehydrogenase